MNNDYALAKRYVNKIQSCNSSGTPFELAIGNSLNCISVKLVTTQGCLYP